MRNGREKHSFEESGYISPWEAEAILQRLASVSVPFESAVSQLDSESVNRRKRPTTAAATLLDLEAKYWTLVEQIPAVVFIAFLGEASARLTSAHRSSQYWVFPSKNG